MALLNSILLTSWSWALLENLPVVQELKNSPTFYGARRFITMFTRAIRLSLFWAISIKTIPPYLISLRYILVLSIHLRLCLPGGLFPYGFPTNIQYAFLSAPIHATCSVPLILIDLITLIIHSEEYKLWSSSLCSFLQPTATSFLFGSNIHLSTLFSNNLNLYTFLNVGDKVSHLYRTTGKTMVLNSLILMFLDSRWEDEGF
jgi:hypothetical protein